MVAVLGEKALAFGYFITKALEAVIVQHNQRCNTSEGIQQQKMIFTLHTVILFTRKDTVYFPEKNVL